jgi:hypothetical protein
MLTKYLLAWAVAVLLVVGGGIAPAAAACYNFVGDYYREYGENLPTSSSAVDVWKLVCPSGTSRAVANIVDLSEDGNRFTLLVVKGSAGITTLRHVPDGEGSSSSDASLSGGSGTYYLQVHKNITTSVPVEYGGWACCLNSASELLPISTLTLIQDR